MILSVNLEVFSWGPTLPSLSRSLSSAHKYFKGKKCLKWLYGYKLVTSSSLSSSGPPTAVEFHNTPMDGRVKNRNWLQMAADSEHPRYLRQRKENTYTNTGARLGRAQKTVYIKLLITNSEKPGWVHLSQTSRPLIKPDQMFGQSWISMRFPSIWWLDQQSLLFCHTIFVISEHTGYLLTKQLLGCHFASPSFCV